MAAMGSSNQSLASAFESNIDMRHHALAGIGGIGATVAEATLSGDVSNSTGAVAYGFLVSVDALDGSQQNRFVQIFRTASDARQALACASPDVQVLINEYQSAEEISPLNLAAALHKDNPLRDIYIQKAQFNRLFTSRVEATGARGIVSIEEADRLLGFVRPELGVSDTSGRLSINESPHKPGEEQPADEQPADEGASAHAAVTPEGYTGEPLALSVEEYAGAPLPTAPEEYLSAQQPTSVEEYLNAQQPASTEEYAGAQLTATVEEYLGEQLPASIQDLTASTIGAGEVSAFDQLAHTPFPTAPVVDLQWLEQVLDLDDLDDPLLFAGPALVERELKLPSTSEPRQSPSKLPGTQPVALYNTDREGEGVVAAFISGRGGVGKSSLTILTAFELWLQGYKVAMLDLDLQFGDLGVLAGNEPESRILRLNIEQLCNKRARVPRLEDSLLILESPEKPELAEELVHEIPELLSALRSVADIVLINTACLWNEAVAVLTSSADKLVICIDQRATSISAARQVLQLCIRLQIPSTQLYYLLNRCSRNAPIMDIDVSLAMGGGEVLTIAEGGADVDELLSLGCPIELLTAQAPLRQSVKELGACLLARPGSETVLRGQTR